MDHGIGRIVAELKRQGQLDNTLVLYMQDNGGCAEVMGRAAKGEWTRRPEKPPFPPMAADALQPDMIPKQTRDGYPVIQGPGAVPGAPDSFIAYGQGWANVSNTPFREYKHWVHEGGISTPLIAHWPDGIRNRGDGIVRDPAHLIDVMATAVDVTGASYPVEVDGRKIPPMEGVSLRPTFEGRKLRRPQPIFWEHEGNRAVREGRWKLVAKESQPWELYDMETDRTEQNDLASAQPERVKELSAKWDAWAARANVLPLGTWRQPAVPAPAAR
jgi:arylsulfatase A-like enzyme